MVIIQLSKCPYIKDIHRCDFNSSCTKYEQNLMVTIKCLCELIEQHINQNWFKRLRVFPLEPFDRLACWMASDFFRQWIYPKNFDSNLIGYESERIVSHWHTNSQCDEATKWNAWNEWSSNLTWPVWKRWIESEMDVENLLSENVQKFPSKSHKRHTFIYIITMTNTGPSHFRLR